jgi:F420-dependent oxidoreductase-like protein
MEFSFMTEPQAGGSYARLLELAQWAEQAGFDSFARSDHYMDGDETAPATDALTTLAGLSRETNTIKLTVLVSPLTFRHPGNLAKTAATIDEMSAGRLELGVGTGWMESEHEVFGFPFPPLKERFTRLEETLAYLRAAFGRDGGGFAGEHYLLSDIGVLPRPTGQLPLIIGGGGPQKTPALAGKYGDELNMFSRPIEELAARRDVMRSAAADAGRDPDAIKLSLVGYPIIGDDRADYRDRLEARAASRDRDPDEFEAFLVERGLLHGTVDQVGEQMAYLREAGVGRFYIQVYAPLDEINTDEVGRALRLLRD